MLALLIPEKFSYVGSLRFTELLKNYYIISYNTEKKIVGSCIYLSMDLPHNFFKGALVICSVAVCVSPALNQPCWTSCYTLEKAGRTVGLSYTGSYAGRCFLNLVKYRMLDSLINYLKE